ncbi:hypothetical protein EMIT036CA2_30442 [Chryseobacterium sp. IT-36CA2]
MSAFFGIFGGFESKKLGNNKETAPNELKARNFFLVIIF